MITALFILLQRKGTPIHLVHPPRYPFTCAEPIIEKNTLQIVMVEHLASALLNYPHKKCERLKWLRFLLLPSTYQLFLVHFEAESTNTTTPASCSRHWEHSFPNDLILYLFSLCLVIELQCLSKKKKKV